MFYANCGHLHPEDETREELVRGRPRERPRGRGGGVGGATLLSPAALCVSIFLPFKAGIAETISRVWWQLFSQSINKTINQSINQASNQSIIIFFY